MVDDNENPSASSKSGLVQDIASSFGKSLLRTGATLLIAFAIGTGAAALACLYYDIPLVFSLIGGVLVLGLSVAFIVDA